MQGNCEADRVRLLGAIAQGQSVQQLGPGGFILQATQDQLSKATMVPVELVGALFGFVNLLGSPAKRVGLKVGPNLSTQLLPRLPEYRLDVLESL